MSYRGGNIQMMRVRCNKYYYFVGYQRGSWHWWPDWRCAYTSKPSYISYVRRPQLRHSVCNYVSIGTFRGGEEATTLSRFCVCCHWSRGVGPRTCQQCHSSHTLKLKLNDIRKICHILRENSLILPWSLCCNSERRNWFWKINSMHMEKTSTRPSNGGQVSWNKSLNSNRRQDNDLDTPQKMTWKVRPQATVFECTNFVVELTRQVIK